MKFGKRLLTCLTLLVIAMMSLGVFAACQDMNTGNSGNHGGNSASSNTGSDTFTGEYYYDAAGSTEWTVTINNDGTYTINMGEGAVTGSYTFDGKALSFDNASYSTSYDATAKAITVTYNGQTYRFVEKIEYTVQYETNGGSNVPSSKVINGKTLSKPADPEYPGKSFVGWYKDAGFNNAFAFGSEPVTGNMTLYARYVDKQEGAAEYTVSFDLNGKTGTAPADMTTIGGIAFNLPEPNVAGETFIGWYYSEYNDPEKLAGKYDEQVLKADTVLYAVWASDGLVVSVEEGLISWTSVGVNARYNIVVFNATTNKAWSRNNISTLEQAYTFADAGEYEVTVKSGTSTAKAYYKYHVLDATKLAIVDNSLTYTAVDNATGYFVTIDCATAGHNHTNFDNGTSLYFDFTACDMKPEGITFTVTAVADGYVSSNASTTLVRNLGEVTGLTVDENATAKWNAVENATGYVVAVTYNGKTETYNTTPDAMNYDLKGYNPGDIKVSVYATAHGYNQSATADYTYAKKTLAAPAKLTFKGEKISWDAVDGAVSYNVKVGNKVVNVTETEFYMNNDVIVSGQTSYDITVQAVGATADTNSLYCDSRTLSYTFVSAVYENGKFVWDAFAGAEYYCLYLNGVRVGETIADNYVFNFKKEGENVVGVSYFSKNGVESEMLTATVNVYALVLDPDGGVQVDEFGNNVTISTLYYATGDAVTLSTDFTKRGYTFGGWYNVKGGAANMGMEYTDTTYQQTESRTLYAFWMANKYKLTLHYDNGDEETVEVTYDQPYNAAVPTTSPDVTHAFAGWYSDLQGNGTQYTNQEGKGSANWTVPYDVTVYSYWVPIFIFTETKVGTVSGYKVEKESYIAFVSEATIPYEYNGKPVLEIAGGGFKNIPTLKVLNVPETIKDCSETTAFDGDSALTAINVYKVENNYDDVVYGSEDGILFMAKDGGAKIVYAPMGKKGELVIPSHVTFGDQTLPVTTIPAAGFARSLLSKITIPYTVTTIEGSCFDQAANLEEIVFEATPEGETPVGLDIHENVFNGLTKLTTLTLPARLDNFDAKAIKGCTNLERINVVGTGGNYSSVGGLLTNAAKTKLLYVPAAYKGPAGDGVYTVAEGITEIGENAFSYNTGVSEVVISAWVEKIGKEAFAKRNSSSSSNAFTSNTVLKKVTFLGDESSNNLVIDAFAFYYCNQFNSITIPANCHDIGEHAFGYTTQLSNVYLESNGAVNYADRAFGSWSTDSTATVTYYVTDLYIGKNVGAFSISGVFGPSKLSTIVIDDGNVNFVSIDNIVYNKDVTALLFVPSDVKGTYTAPNTLKEIGAGAFNGRTGLEKVVFGYGIERIGTDAFSGCTGLTEIEFAATPDGTDPADLEIGAQAFRGCTKITAIAFPERTRTVNAAVFFGCTSLTSISLPSTLTNIVYGRHVEQLGDGTTAEEVTYDYVDAFSIAASRTSPKLASLTVAEGNTKYKTINNALYELDESGNPVKLLTVAQAYTGNNGILALPATVELIETRALYYCNIAQLTFPNGAAEDFQMNPYAIQYSAITRMELPTGMKTIGIRSFAYATLMTYVKIPYTVTSIKYGAFYYCYGVTNFDFEETPAGTDPVELRIEGCNPIAGNPTSGTKRGDGTRYFDTRTTTTASFYDCYGMTELVLPERTTYIGPYSFYFGTSSVKLAKVVIPSTVQEIGDHAFYASSASYSKLNEIVFATRDVTVGEGESAHTEKVSSLKKIGDYAFNYAQLTSLELPDSVEYIGVRAFYYNSLLTSVKLPASLKTIEEQAFYYCSKLTSITIPASTTFIGDRAFAYTTLMKTITFATAPVEVQMTDDGGETTTVTKYYSSITQIDKEAFYSSGITSFTFPETPNEILLGSQSQKRLFNACKGLFVVGFNSKLSDIADLFYGCTSIREFNVPDDNENFAELEGTPLLMNRDKKTVKLCTNVSGTFTVPEGVTGIGDQAFYGLTGLTKIVLPSTLRTIGTGAFLNCTGLTEVVIKTDATGDCALSSIGKQAFSGCTALTTFYIPGTAEVETLSEEVFNNCTKLTNFVFPALVKRVEAKALYNCTNLALATLPASITYIGNSAFYKVGLVNATLNSAIELEDGAFTYAQELTNVTIEEGVTEIPNDAFYYCSALTTINIPSTVTTIGWRAFYQCGLLHTVTFDKNAEGSYALTTIKMQAFAYTKSLSEIELPGTVNYVIGTTYSFPTAANPTAAQLATRNSSAALFYYSGVGKVTFGEGTNLIPAYTFYYADQLQEVVLPHSLDEIGLYAFDMCGLPEVTIPYSVTKIGNYAFAGTSSTPSKLQSITFEETPEGVTPKNLTIGTYTFNYAVSLESVDLPARLKFTTAGTSATAAGNQTFGYSGVRRVSLPEGMTIIPYGFFRYASNLTEVVMPSTITTLGNYAFANTGNIAELTIPAGVVVKSASTSTYLFQNSGVKKVVIEGNWTHLPNNLFDHAQNLEEITLPASVTTLGNYVFAYTSSLKHMTLGSKIKVASTTASTYMFQYSGVESVTIEGGWTAIPNYMFYHAEHLTSFTIPSTVKTIGNYAFSNTTSLKSMVLPETLDAVTDPSKVTYLFQYSGIENVTFPSKWTVIPNYCFYYCSNLKEFEIPDNITQIGQYAFYQCSALKTLNIPASVKTLGNNAFGYTSSLKSVVLPDTLDPVTDASKSTGLFTYSGIESATLPSNWTVIPNSTFSNCRSLKSYTIGENVKTIGNSAFYYTLALESIVLPETLDPLTDAGKSTQVFGYSGISSITFPSHWTVIPNSFFSNCKNLTSFQIPANITAIGNTAMNYMNLPDDVVLPKGLTTIGNGAFGFSSYKTIYIPNTVTSIGYYAFYNNPTLEKVTFEEGFTSLTMGYREFDTCPALTVVENFPDAMVSTVVGTGSGTTGSQAYMFYKTNVKEFTIPSTWEVIPYGMFYMNTGLESITIPANIREIGTYAFSECAELTEANCAERTTTLKLNGSVFRNSKKLAKSNVTEYIVSSNSTTSTATAENVYTFAGTSLESVTIPNTWTAVAYGMFDGIETLTSIYIPKNVVSVGTYAFRNCVNVETLEFAPDSKLTTIGGSAFMNLAKVKSVDLPKGLTITAVGTGSANGSTSDGGALFMGSGVEEVTLPAGVTALTAQMFSGATHLKKLTVMGDLTATFSSYYPGSTGTYVSYATFYNTPALEEVVFAGNNVTIGNYLFRGYDTLEGEDAKTPWTVTFKGNVASIGSLCFSGARGLTDVTFEGPVDTVMGGAFCICPELVNVEFFDNVGTLGSSNITYTLSGVSYTGGFALGGNASLNNVKFHGTIESVGSYAFANDRALVSIDLNSALTIGDYAFAMCPVLENAGTKSAVSLGKYLFAYTQNIKNYTFPEDYILTSTSDGEGMFYGSKVESVTLPANVTVIPNYFIAECKDITALNVQGALTAIGDGAFEGCALTSFTIPETVTSIGEAAFKNCNMKTMNVPKNVSEIGGGAFAWCFFDTFTVDPANTYYTIDTIGDLVRMSDYHVIMVPCSIEGTYTMSSISTYDAMSFQGSKITKLIVEAGPVDLDEYMFYDMPEVEEIVLPDTVKTVGNYAFANCPKLKSITLPANVEYIGKYAFYGDTALKTATMGNKVTEIGEYAFANSGITTVTIPDSVKKFGQYVFADCADLEEVTFSGDRKAINGPTTSTYLYLFENCAKLQYVNLPENLTTARGLLGHVYSDRLVIGGTVKTIPSYAFYYCYAKEVVLPDTLEKISDYGFYYCNELLNITIPASVKTISKWAFEYAGKAATEENDFYDSTLTIMGSFDLVDYAFYYANFNTIKFDDSIEVIDTTANGARTAYNHGMFYYTKAKHVVFPANLKTLNAPYMFYGAEVQEVTLPATLETFNSPYFLSFSKVAYFDMSAATKITEMPEYFAYAYSYVDPNSGSEQSPSTNAFLTTVKLPATMKNISDHAFYRQLNLEHIEMPASLEKIDKYAFYYCQALKEMVVPNGVTSIGDYAFYYLTTCKYVTVPASVRTLGTYVFYSTASNVLDIYMEADQDNGPTIGSYAFGTNTNVHWATYGPLLLDATMWDAEDATERYVAYFFNANGEGEPMWVDMTSKGDGLWAATAPMGYDSVIFVRMNGETTENVWENKWNQTGNLSANNYGKTFTVNAWGENGAPSTGEWN